MCRLEIICELCEYARDNNMEYQQLLLMYYDYTDTQLIEEYYERYGETVEIE